jgi:hypothetical protein
MRCAFFSYEIIDNFNQNNNYDSKLTLMFDVSLMLLMLQIFSFRVQTVFLRKATAA